MYFGPETYLPLASIVAGATGLILTFWRRLKGAFRRPFDHLFRSKKEPSGDRKNKKPSPSSRGNRRRRPRGSR